MGEIKLAAKLTALRKEYGITQDTLAEFVGVSKASVSKWETGQSLPDITILPKLASYFSCTIDEMMGYEAQLEKDKIRKIYKKLTVRFAKEPFEEVMKECNKWIKEYYSCYPFLHQMCILLANHHMLAGSESRKAEILEQAISLCKRVVKNTDDVLLAKDTVVFEAVVYLMMKKPKKVFELLGNTIHPYTSSDELIAQAYQMTGELDKANDTIQICMFQHMMSLMQALGMYLNLHMQEEELSEEIMSRMFQIIDAFDIQSLNPNTSLGVFYQIALTYCIQGKQEDAILYLRKYLESIDMLVKDFRIHGDQFFDRIDSFIETLDLGAMGVRDKKVVVESVLETLENPVFTPLFERPDYKQLKAECKNKYQL